MTYQSALEHVHNVKTKLGGTWDAIRPKDAARMIVQNRFKTGLDIAKYTASIMRRDMAEYDADNSKYTQSLGCWHGFIAQQKMALLNQNTHLKLPFHLANSKFSVFSIIFWHLE